MLADPLEVFCYQDVSVAAASYNDHLMLFLCIFSSIFFKKNLDIIEYDSEVAPPTENDLFDNFCESRNDPSYKGKFKTGSDA